MFKWDRPVDCQHRELDKIWYDRGKYWEVITICKDCGKTFGTERKAK